MGSSHQTPTKSLQPAKFSVTPCFIVKHQKKEKGDHPSQSRQSSRTRVHKATNNANPKPNPKPNPNPNPNHKLNPDQH